MWFVLNGIPIRYSLREHALISGLNCSAYPEDSKNIGSDEFRKRNFPKMKKISLIDVKEVLQDMKVSPEEGHSSKRKRGDNNRESQRATLQQDKLKMSILYFLCSVLMGNKNTIHIGDDLIKIVDDLERCRTFPWGRCSYHYLMGHVQKLDLYKKSRGALEKMPTWTCPGFILPLMILPFECIPALSPQFALIRKDVLEPMPRMCQWTTKFNKHKARTLQQVLHVVGDTKDERSILVPTPEEQQANYIQEFVPDDDVADDTIDQCTTKLEAGISNIFWEDFWCADQESQRKFLHLSGGGEEVHEEDRDEAQDIRHEESRPYQATSPVGQSRSPRSSPSPFTVESMRQTRISADELRVLHELKALEQRVEQRVEKLSAEVKSQYSQLEKMLTTRLDKLINIMERYVGDGGRGRGTCVKNNGRINVTRGVNVDEGIGFDVDDVVENNEGVNFVANEGGILTNIINKLVPQQSVLEMEMRLEIKMEIEVLMFSLVGVEM